MLYCEAGRTKVHLCSQGYGVRISVKQARTVFVSIKRIGSASSFTCARKDGFLVDDEDHVKGDSEMISAYGAWKAHKESCDKCGYS